MKSLIRDFGIGCLAALLLEVLWFGGSVILWWRGMRNEHIGAFAIDIAFMVLLILAGGTISTVIGLVIRALRKQ